MKRTREQNGGDGERTSLNNPSLVSTGNSIGTSTSSSDRLPKQAHRDHKDQGHRYGNFHNYYAFHPASNRTKHIEEILTYIAHQWNNFSPLHKRNSFRYTDIGCNEGELTIEIAKLLSNHISNPSLSTRPNIDEKDTVIAPQHVDTQVLCTGFDLDADLIRSAEIKVQEDDGLQPNIQAKFKVLDVLHEDIVLKHSGESTTDCVTPSNEYSTDLTTLFSTAMWIHIHGGDDGLRRVLQKICSLTQFWILLEPQPSKCYGRAAFRLRRLGLPPIDVSNDRLRLRPNIEEAIENILKELQFERVKLNNQNSYNKIDKQEEASIETKTQWNRPLQLYQRVNISNTCSLNEK